MNKVFVYGSLLSKLSNHRVLGDSKMITKDSINGFTMYSLGPFPALVLNENSSVEISGEVYEVDSNTMTRLDNLEGYPSFYDRMEVTTNNGHQAFVYYIKGNRLYDVEVESGNWKEFLGIK